MNQRTAKGIRATCKERFGVNWKPYYRPAKKEYTRLKKLGIKPI